MDFLSVAMLVLFTAAWCVAIAAWLYGVRYFMPMWLAGFRKTERHEGYGRKAVAGFVVFVAAIAVCFVAGWIAKIWGTGWQKRNVRFPPIADIGPNLRLLRISRFFAANRRWLEDFGSAPRTGLRQY